MSGTVQRTCQVCGRNAGFFMSDDEGSYYCGYCNSRADDIFDTGVDEEQIFSHYSASCTRARPASANVIAPEPISQVKPSTSQYDFDHPPDVSMDDVGDGIGPTGPSDFGSSKQKISYAEYSSEIRSRYLTGIQTMIQLQCKALVEDFNVSPLIIGLMGPLWLRFLASTRITSDDWANRVFEESETQTQGEAREIQPSSEFCTEPKNFQGKRLVYVWYSHLRSTIPISSTLAISFLVCHVAREPITPPDMLRWVLEGKLPYFAAFNEIEKRIGATSDACPIRTSRMFRPVQLISSQKLESMAAGVARKIGLELPAVNFYAIASRYLRQLSLPISEILPSACRVYEWSGPPELYLSANESRIPTRVCVMSILVVTMRILFNINGYGIWESSLSVSSDNSEPSCTKSDSLDTGLDAVKLLQILEEKYGELDDVHAYSCDLPSYLQYCKDVVFSGLRPSYENLEEEKLMEEFWDFYLKNKDIPDNREDVHPSKQKGVEKTKFHQNTSSRDTSQEAHICLHGNRSSTRGSQPSKDEAIRRLKSDMEDNIFCYIPPRVKVKRKDHLHYARRRKDVYVYAVHADYYILLRSCAKVAQVEMRVMHGAVLSLERRLQWLEQRVDSLLGVDLNFDNGCGFCKDKSERNFRHDSMDLNSRF
ncbi:hypothetical protein OROMI_033050 [Orobanche minor]